MHFRNNSDGLPLYHLRRIGEKATIPDAADVMDFFRPTTLIGRNTGVSDYLIYSSNPNSLYISRNHARVIRSVKDNSHRLVDMSLTGVFVNDIKTDGDVVLQEGDTVTFGHPEGKNINPGTKVRQPSSEYYFLFERCCCPADGTSPLPPTVVSSAAQTQLPVLTSFQVPYFGHTGLFLGTNSQVHFPAGLWAASTTVSSSSSAFSLSPSTSEMTRKGRILINQFAPSSVTLPSTISDNGCSSECNGAVPGEPEQEAPSCSSSQRAVLSKLSSESLQCHGVLETSDDIAASEGEVLKANKSVFDEMTEKSVKVNSYGAGVPVGTITENLGQVHGPLLDEHNCQKALFGSSELRKTPEGKDAFPVDQAHLSLPHSKAESLVYEPENVCDVFLQGVKTIQVQLKGKLTSESEKEDSNTVALNVESDILLVDNKSINDQEGDEIKECARPFEGSPAGPLPLESSTHESVSVEECAVISPNNTPVTGEFKQCEVNELRECNTDAGQERTFDQNSCTFRKLAICVEEESYVNGSTESPQLQSQDVCARDVIRAEKNGDQHGLSESVCTANVAFSAGGEVLISEHLLVKGSESQCGGGNNMEVADDSDFSNTEMITSDDQCFSDKTLTPKMYRNIHVTDERFMSQSTGLEKEQLESDICPPICKIPTHTLGSSSFVGTIDEGDSTCLISPTSIDTKHSSDVQTQSNQPLDCMQKSDVCIRSELSLEMKGDLSLDFKRSLNKVPDVSCQADSGLPIVNLSHYNVDSDKDFCESCISKCEEFDKVLPESKCQMKMGSYTKLCVSNSECDVQLRIPECVNVEGGAEFVKDELDFAGGRPPYVRSDEAVQHPVPTEDLEYVQDKKSTDAEPASKCFTSEYSASVLHHKTEGGLVVSDKCDRTENCSDTLNRLEENFSSNVCDSMQNCKLETDGNSTVKLGQWKTAEDCTGSSEMCFSLEKTKYEHVISGAEKVAVAVQSVDDGEKDAMECRASVGIAVVGSRTAESAMSSTLLEDCLNDEKDRNSRDIYDSSLSEYFICSQENNNIDNSCSSFDSPLSEMQADAMEILLPPKSEDKEGTVELFSLQTGTNEKNVDPQSCGVEHEHLSNCDELSKHYSDPSRDTDFHQELVGSKLSLTDLLLKSETVGFSVPQEIESIGLSASSVVDDEMGENVEPSIIENDRSVCKSPCTNEISGSSFEAVINSDNHFGRSEFVKKASSCSIRNGTSEGTPSILDITPGEGAMKVKPTNEATYVASLMDSSVADSKNRDGDEDLKNCSKFSAVPQFNTPSSVSEHALDLPSSIENLQNMQYNSESECDIENEERVQEEFSEESCRLQTVDTNVKCEEKYDNDDNDSCTDVLQVPEPGIVFNRCVTEIEGNTNITVNVSNFVLSETDTANKLINVAVVETDGNSDIECNSCTMDGGVHSGVENKYEEQQQLRECDFGTSSKEKKKVYSKSEVGELINVAKGELTCTAASAEHSSVNVTVEKEFTKSYSFYPQNIVNERYVSSNKVDQMDSQKVIGNLVYTDECSIPNAEMSCEETREVNVKNMEEDNFSCTSVNEAIQHIVEQDKEECSQLAEQTIQIRECSVQLAAGENLDQNADVEEKASAHHVSVKDGERIEKCREEAKDDRYDGVSPCKCEFLNEEVIDNARIKESKIQKSTENDGKRIKDDSFSLLKQEALGSMGIAKDSLQNISENNEPYVCNLKNLVHFDTATVVEEDTSQSLNSRCSDTISECKYSEMMVKKDTGDKILCIPCLAENKQDMLTAMSKETIQPFVAKKDAQDVENSLDNLNEVKYCPYTNVVEMSNSENKWKGQEESWCHSHTLVNVNDILNTTNVKCSTSDTEIEVDDENFDNKKACTVNDQVAIHTETFEDHSIQNASDEENICGTQVDSTVQGTALENTHAIEQINTRDAVDSEIEQCYTKMNVDERESPSLNSVCESSIHNVDSETERSAEECLLCNVETTQTDVQLTKSAGKHSVEEECERADSGITQTEALAAGIVSGTLESVQESNTRSITAEMDISQNMCNTARNSALEEYCGEAERKNSFGLQSECKYPEIDAELSAHCLEKTDNKHVAAVPECAILSNTGKSQEDRKNSIPQLKEREYALEYEESKKRVHKDSMHNLVVKTGLYTSTAEYQSINVTEEIQQLNSHALVEEKDHLISQSRLQSAVNETRDNKSGAHSVYTAVKSMERVAASEVDEEQGIQELATANAVSTVKMEKYDLQNGRATDLSKREDYIDRTSVKGKDMYSETELCNMLGSTGDGADASHIYDKQDVAAKGDQTPEHSHLVKLVDEKCAVTSDETGVGDKKYTASTEPVDGDSSLYMISKLENEDKTSAIKDLAASMHNVDTMNIIQSVSTEKQNEEVKESSENGVYGKNDETSLAEKINECHAMQMKQKLSNCENASADASNISEESYPGLGILQSKPSPDRNIKCDMEKAEQLMVHQVSDEEADYSEQLELCFAEEFCIELSDSDIDGKAPCCQNAEDPSKTFEKKIKDGEQTLALEFGSTPESVSSHLPWVKEPCFQNGVDILSTGNALLEREVGSADSLQASVTKMGEVDKAGVKLPRSSEGKLLSTPQRHAENDEQPSSLLSKGGESTQNENKQISDAEPDLSCITHDSLSDLVYEKGSFSHLNFSSQNVKHNQDSVSKELKLDTEGKTSLGTEGQTSSVIYCSSYSQDSAANVESLTEQLECIPDEDAKVGKSVSKGINALELKCNLEKLKSTLDCHSLPEKRKEMTVSKCSTASSENVKPGLCDVTVSSEPVCNSVSANDLEQNSRDACQKEVTRDGRHLKKSLHLVSLPSNLGHKDKAEITKCMSLHLNSRSHNNCDDIAEDKNDSERPGKRNNMCEMCSIKQVSELSKNVNNIDCKHTVTRKTECQLSSCSSDEYILEEHSSSDAEMLHKDVSSDSKTLAEEQNKNESSVVVREVTKNRSCSEKLKRRYMSSIETDASGSLDKEHCPPKKVLLLEHTARLEVTTLSLGLNTTSFGSVKLVSSKSELIGNVVRQFFKSFTTEKEMKSPGNVSVQNNIRGGEIARLVRDFFRKAETTNKNDIESRMSVLEEGELSAEEMLDEHSSLETKGQDDSSSFSSPVKRICKEQCSESEGMQFVNSGSKFSLVRSAKDDALVCSSPSCEIRGVSQGCASVNLELPGRNMESISEMQNLSISNPVIQFDGDEHSSDQVKSEVLDSANRSSACSTDMPDKSDTSTNGSSSPKTDVVQPSQCFDIGDHASWESDTFFLSSQGIPDEINCFQKSSSQLKPNSGNVGSGSSPSSNKEADDCEMEEETNLSAHCTASKASSCAEEITAEKCNCSRTADQAVCSAASCLCSQRIHDMRYCSQKTFSHASSTSSDEAHEMEEEKESGSCLITQSDISFSTEINGGESSKCADCVDHERCISATSFVSSQGSMDIMDCSQDSLSRTCVNSLDIIVSNVEDDVHEMGEKNDSTLATCSHSGSPVSSLPEKNTESSKCLCGEGHARCVSTACTLNSQRRQDVDCLQKTSQIWCTYTPEYHDSGLSISNVEVENHEVEVQNKLDTCLCINSVASFKVNAVELSECSGDVDHSVCDSTPTIGSSLESLVLTDCSQNTSAQTMCNQNCDSLSHSAVDGEVCEIGNTCSSADESSAHGSLLVPLDNIDERSISSSQVTDSSTRVIVSSNGSWDTNDAESATSVAEIGLTRLTSSLQQLSENTEDNMQSSLENGGEQVAESCGIQRETAKQEDILEENDSVVSTSCQTVVFKCSPDEELPPEGEREHGRVSDSAYTSTATSGAAEVSECRQSLENEGECCPEAPTSFMLPLKRKSSKEECDSGCAPLPPASSESEDELDQEVTHERAKAECSNFSQSYLRKNSVTECEMHCLNSKEQKISPSLADCSVNASRHPDEISKVVEFIVIESSDEEETNDDEKRLKVKTEEDIMGSLNTEVEEDSDLCDDGSGSCREMERSAYSSVSVLGYGISGNALELHSVRGDGDCVWEDDGTRSQNVFRSSTRDDVHCLGLGKSLCDLKTEAFSSTDSHTANESSHLLSKSGSQNICCPRALSPVFEPQYPVQTSRSIEVPSSAHQPQNSRATQNCTSRIQELMNYKIQDKLQLPVDFDDDDDDDALYISMEDLDKVYSSDEESVAIRPGGIKDTVGSLHNNQSSQHSCAEHSHSTCSNRGEPAVKSKPAESSTNSITLNDGSVTPDLSRNSRCWAVSEQVIDHQMQECNSVLKAIQKSLLSVEGIDEAHMVQWRDQITELLKQTDSPKTYIAVVGDTGAGKSCLLNALLDEEALLPTSAMRACTASVVEVSCNLANQNYEADVEFLTEEEWYKELEALIKDLKDKNGNFKKRRLDPKSEAGVAFNRVKAVYGDIAEVAQLKQIQNVTKYLGKTKHITEEKVAKFRSRIERFILSSADSSRGRKGGEYWPIVKRVQLRVPTADVLKSGAVLVDLPGIKDSNAARNSVAKEYLKTCNAVWVVANITRAVDDKTAKDMLNESLRTQLFMDGQYGRIAFICTKTDCYSIIEICGAVPINDRIQPLEDENAELEEQINQIKSEKEQLYGKLKEQNIEDDTSKDPSSDANELRNAILKNDIMMSSLQRKKESNSQAIALECVKARNKFSKRQIQQDFICGMQEIKRASNEDDDGSDEDELMSVASEDFCSDSNSEEDGKLHVFTVSSIEYLKLQGKLLREGLPQVFNFVEDTEIPALKSFTIKTAMKQRVVAAEKLVRSVASFISHVVTYLTNQRAQDESFQALIRETVQFCLSSVRNTLQGAVAECIDSVEKAFLVVIKTYVSMGVKRAVAACGETAKTWGSPDKPGKYPYATYRAICVRQGVYSSRAFGHIDLNEELSQPVSTTISVAWNQVFSKDLPGYLDSFKTNILRKLKEFFREVKGKLRDMNMSTAAVEYIQRQQMEAVEAELHNFIIDLKEYIMQRQREISRILTPSVQACMSPAFIECAKQNGTGCFQRMKTHMCNFIQTEKITMFHLAGELLIVQLTFLQREIRGRLAATLDELCESLTVQFEPVLKPVKKNKGIIPDLVQICRQVREICQRSHIEFVLNDPGEEEESSASTSRAATIKSNGNEPDFLEGTCDIVIEDDTASPKKYRSHAQITVNAVTIKSAGDFPSLCIEFTQVEFCEFCPYMYYLRLHIRTSCGFNVSVVRSHHDQLNMNPLKILLIMDKLVDVNHFCRLMKYISEKHGGQPWFQKLDTEQVVDKLRSLGVIYHCSDNKTSTKEEYTVVAAVVPSFSPSSTVSSHSSVPCSYQPSTSAGIRLSPYGRKRGSDSLQTPALYDHKIRVTVHGPETVSQSPETSCSSLLQNKPVYWHVKSGIPLVSRWTDPNSVPSTSRCEADNRVNLIPTVISATASEPAKAEEDSQWNMSRFTAAPGLLYMHLGSSDFGKLYVKKEDNEK